MTLPRLKSLLADCAAGRGRRRVVLSFIRSELFSDPDPRLVFLVRLLDEVRALATCNAAQDRIDDARDGVGDDLPHHDAVPLPSPP